MLVKIIMRRRIKDRKAREVFSLIRKLRAHAMNQKGYISGETLVDHSDPQKTMVIGTWQSMDDWLKWKEDLVRIKLEKQLETLLESPTEYEAYVFSKYYLSVSGEGH